MPYSVIGMVPIPVWAPNVGGIDLIIEDKVNGFIVNKNLNINNDIDVLVLGCTHFPILAKPISDYFNTQVQLLDSGAAIAKRVSSLLKLSDNQAGIKKPLHYYATADVCSDKLAVKQVTLSVSYTHLTLPTKRIV